jgi:hypothetical protein
MTQTAADLFRRADPRRRERKTGRTGRGRPDGLACSLDCTPGEIRVSPAGPARVNPASRVTRF